MRSTIHEGSRRFSFEVTGALITADGTDDTLIRPMRGLDYTVPLFIIDLTIDRRVLEEQNNLAADAEGNPKDENVYDLLSLGLNLLIEKKLN